LIRYSGTENKIRLLLEGDDKLEVESSMDTLVSFIKSKLC
jgi:phosphoglucosamine mutase